MSRSGDGDDHLSGNKAGIARRRSSSRGSGGARTRRVEREDPIELAS